MELVDTTDSKSVAFNGVGVRLPLTLPRGVAQSGSASALGAEGRRFESCRPDQLFGGVAQLGERRLCKPKVRGSIPLTSTIL